MVTTSAAAKNKIEKVIFENCTLFIDCISETNYLQVDNSKDIDPLMQVYNLMKYSNNYSKTSRLLRNDYRDETITEDIGLISNFTADANSDPLKFKPKPTGQTDNNGTIDVEIMIPLKYLLNFWKNLKMTLVNFEIDLILPWSANCIIASHTHANQATTFAVTCCSGCYFIN